jgi:hypothetical protein
MSKIKSTGWADVPKRATLAPADGLTYREKARELIGVIVRQIIEARASPGGCSYPTTVSGHHGW